MNTAFVRYGRFTWANKSDRSKVYDYKGAKDITAVWDMAGQDPKHKFIAGIAEYKLKVGIC